MPTLPNNSKRTEAVKKQIPQTNTISGLDEAINPRVDVNDKRVYIFFSIDLTNSTEYKKLHTQWPEDFHNYFDVIKGSVESKIPGLILWKFIGDEIIYYKELFNLSEVLEFPPKALYAMKYSEGQLLDNPQTENTILGIKGAIWIAPVRYSGSPHDYIKNIFFEKNDFLGLDFDIGFRSSKFVEKNKLQVDAKIAYLVNLYKDDPNVETTISMGGCTRYRIAAFRKLKGVWGGRAYPIVWYQDNWNEIKSTFKYDDHLNSDIVRELDIHDYNAKPLSMMESIINDVDLKDEINCMIDILMDPKPPRKLKPDNTVELHLSAVCIDPDIEKVLIVKRSNMRRSYKNTWEFGCTRDVEDQEIQSLIVDKYAEYFNIKIRLLGDKDCNGDEQLIPLWFYKVVKNGKNYTGITVAAVIEHKIQKDKKHYPNIKHYEARFVDVADITEMEKNDESLMAGLKESAKKALDIYKKSKDKP